MSKQHQMSMEDIGACILSKFRLRNEGEPLNKSVAEYAALMKEHGVFPPVVIGIYSDAEGVETRILIDGYLRIRAAQSLGLKSFAVEEVRYDSEVLALADMLKRNHGRGKDVTPGERNKRVEMLFQRGLKQKEIAPLVNLTAASVSRILDGTQGDGNPGKKNEGKTHVGRKRSKNGVKKLKADITTPEGLFLILEELPNQTKAQMEKLIAGGKVTEKQVYVVRAAIVALNTLEHGLSKAVGASRKKAA